MASIFEKLRHAEQDEEHADDHLKSGKHAHQIAQRHDVAIAHRCERGHGEIQQLKKGETPVFIPDAEMVGTGRMIKGHTFGGGGQEGRLVD